METVVVQEAWSESVPDYDLIIFSDGYKTSDRQDARRYLKAHDVSYSVQTVFKDIQHPAVTEQRKVVDRAAWTETVEDGGHWEYY